MEIKKGDLFLLGPHRLLYGNALSLMDVQKLMNGKVAEMLWTDPPYNVNYIPETNRGPKSRKKNPLGGIINDEKFNYKKWFGILDTGIIKGSMYITNIFKNFCTIYPWLKEYFQKDPIIILWMKNVHVLSRTDYHRSYEVIFYNRSGSGVWNGGRNQNCEWYIKLRNTLTYVHPTQKPLRLIQKAILNNSNPEDIVLDMFGGSGSTLIACEQNNRICYSMELDPKYVRIIIERWESLTKQQATKVEA